MSSEAGTWPGCPAGVLGWAVQERERQRPEIVPPIPPVSPTCRASLFSLQLRQQARAALTRASSSVQAATVTVTGARTLLADLEGMRALPSPGLLDACLPVTATWTLASAGAAGPQETEVQLCGHKPSSSSPHPRPGPLPGLLDVASHTSHRVLTHTAVSHQTTHGARQGRIRCHRLSVPGLVCPGRGSCHLVQTAATVQGSAGAAGREAEFSLGRGRGSMPVQVSFAL